MRIKDIRQGMSVSVRKGSAFFPATVLGIESGLVTVSLSGQSLAESAISVRPNMVMPISQPSGVESATDAVKVSSTISPAIRPVANASNGSTIGEGNEKQTRVRGVTDMSKSWDGGIAYIPLSDGAVSAITTAHLPDSDPTEFRIRFDCLKSDRSGIVANRKRPSASLSESDYWEESNENLTVPKVQRITPDYRRTIPADMVIPSVTAGSWVVAEWLKSLQAEESTSRELAVILPKPLISRIGDRMAADRERNRRRHGRVEFVSTPAGVIPTYHGGMTRQAIGAGQYGRRMERNLAWCKELTKFEEIPAFILPSRATEYRLDKKARPVAMPDVTPFGIVTETDVREIRRIAKVRCYSKDSQNGTHFAPNVWEDVAQDAVIRFAAFLQESKNWEVAEADELGRPTVFTFRRKIRQDDETADAQLDWDSEDDEFEPVESEPEYVEYPVTRQTLYGFSVRQAMIRPEFNSRRTKVNGMPEYVGMTNTLGEEEVPDGKWNWSGRGHAEYVNTAYLHTTASNPLSESTFHLAFGDPDSRPMLARILSIAAEFPGLTKAQILLRVSKETWSTDSPTGKQKAVSLSRAMEEYDEFVADLAAIRHDWRAVADL